MVRTVILINRVNQINIKNNYVMVTAVPIGGRISILLMILFDVDGTKSRILLSRVDCLTN